MGADLEKPFLHRCTEAPLTCPQAVDHPPLGMVGGSADFHVSLRLALNQEAGGDVLLVMCGKEALGRAVVNICAKDDDTAVRLRTSIGGRVCEHAAMMMQAAFIFTPTAHT